jgi:hypothetical protein
LEAETRKESSAWHIGPCEGTAYRTSRQGVRDEQICAYDEAVPRLRTCAQGHKGMG